MKLFSGSAHPALTEEVSQLLSLPIGRSELTRFNDSEIKITIQENVKNTECVIIQTTINPTDTHYMELFLFGDALKRQEAKKMVAVIPYFGYSRQDKQHRPGECISLNIIVRILELIGFEKVITLDLHDDASADMFSIAFKNLSGLPEIARHMKKSLPALTVKDTVVISPDQEGIERARLFSDTLFGKDKGTIGSVEKQRNLDAIHQSRAVEVFADVTGKTVILVDDVVTSGGTLINAAKLCLSKGATGVYAAVTHADLSPDTPEKFSKSVIKKVYVSNTFPVHAWPKFETVSIAPVIAKELQSDKNV